MKTVFLFWFGGNVLR